MLALVRREYSASYLVYVLPFAGIRSAVHLDVN